MKTFLILINNAPKMGAYHKALGDKLKSEGHQVIYALTDHVIETVSKVDFSNENTFVFSDYFKKNFEILAFDSKYSDINIWKCYFSDYDRNTVHYNLPVFSGNYYESLMINLINFFDEIINLFPIDFIIYENISNSFVYVAYEVGKKNNIAYRGYVGSRLPNRFELHTEEFGIKNQFKEKFDNIDLSKLSEEVKEEIETYLSKFSGNTIPSYHPKKSKLSADYSLVDRYFNKEKFDQFQLMLKSAFDSEDKTKYNYQIQSPFISYGNLFKRQIEKKIRTKKGGHLFEGRQEGDEYYLFPLHMKPESSTSVLAKDYCDDIAVLRNIAFNLPFGKKLYVKEHFVNYGNFPLEIYKEIKEIPNVRLIGSNENSMDLVKNADAIITLTSTMGLEALFMNKPVFVFGEVFYSAHPDCIKVNHYGELFGLLSQLEKNGPNTIENNKINNQKFVAAYRSITYEGHIGYPIYEEDNFTRFVVPFFNALKTYDQL